MYSGQCNAQIKETKSSYVNKHCNGSGSGLRCCLISPQLLCNPLKALQQALPRDGAGGLDMPVVCGQGDQVQALGQLWHAHGAWLQQRRWQTRAGEQTIACARGREPLCTHSKAMLPGGRGLYSPGLVCWRR